jgi:hypothetical protein
MVHKGAVGLSTTGSKVRKTLLFRLFQAQIYNPSCLIPCGLAGETDKAASDNYVGVVWKKPPKIWEFA